VIATQKSGQLAALSGAKPQPKMCTFYLGLASLIFEFLISKYEKFSPE
jgi:hypothetical protein